MHGAKVPDHIDDPEFFVARRGFHDLFGGRKFDQRRVFQLRMDWHDVLRVILHSTRRGVLRLRRKRRERDSEQSDEDAFVNHQSTSTGISVRVSGLSLMPSGKLSARYRRPSTTP